MALGFGEQRIIAAIAGAWVTAFTLVAVWLPGPSLFELIALTLVGAFLFVWLWFGMNYKMLAAYALGSTVVLLFATLFRSGLL